MAREWLEGETITLIVNKVAAIAPDNTAIYPFTFHYDAKEGLWHVDVMVKRPPKIEYDVHAEAPDLRTALKGAYKRLGNWQMLERSQLS